MRAMQFAVFIIFVETVIGITCWSMGYTDQSWFPGYVNAGNGDNSQLTKYNNTSGVLTEDQMQAMGFDEGSSTEVGFAAKSWGMKTLAWNVATSIFHIRPLLNDLFVVEDPNHEGENLFENITWLIQIGIYLIYMFGFLELLGISIDV